LDIEVVASRDSLGEESPNTSLTRSCEAGFCYLSEAGFS